MRTLGTLWTAALAAVLLGAAPPAGAALLRAKGTSRPMLASPGEIHDAVVALFGQDPRVTVQDGKDLIVASWLDGTQPIKLTAKISAGPTDDQSGIEILCEGPRAEGERRRLETEWLDRIPSSIKYYGLQVPPDLRSPLDEGPRAELPPTVPSIDQFRRY
jgi:hypothetical protein